jgi:RNA polymerase sigma-70 factor (ECF subfamily)
MPGNTSMARDATAMNQSDFEAEALQHLPALMALATRLTRSRAEAEDLVQDTLVKALRAREQYRTETNLRAWLLKILRNTFLNGYRRQSLERRVLDGPDKDPLAAGWIGAASLRAMRDPDTNRLHSQLERTLKDAIDELPPDFRMTVLLADVEELSYREIAEAMECPVGTVMSRLHRGRRLLKARLLDEAAQHGIVDKAPANEEIEQRDKEQGDKELSSPLSLKRYRQKKGLG